MKTNLIVVGAGIVLFFIIAVSSCTRIAPTEAGFKINNSGNYRGLDSLPLLTGYQWCMPFTQKIITISTVQQHVVWSQDSKEGSDANQEITISCEGGAGFAMDIGFNYAVNPYKASKIYLTYNTADLESISTTFLRNAVRGAMQDVSGTLTVDSILNNLPAYEHAVYDLLKERLAPVGFNITLFNVISQPRPTDKDLAASINAKIKARQDAERTKMELQSSIAEAQKSVATARGDSASKVIEAAGEAEAIRRKQSVITPEYVEFIKAEKWNGALPQYMTSGAGLLFNVK